MTIAGARLVLQREPTPRETELALAFVGAAEAEQATADRSELTPWQQLAQVLLMSNEFMVIE